MNWPATIGNSLWTGSSLPAWLNFQRALSHPAQAQQKLLGRLLAGNAGCAYGRTHGFSGIKCYEEFTRRVPLMDYADLEPWIDRIRQGESQLLTQEPVTHLIPTSGSTGARKLIPFTAGLQNEFNRAISPWLADLAYRHPAILFGPAYWSITPPQPAAETKPSAVPVGFADDASYLGGAKARLARATMVPAGEISPDASLEEFRFHTLLCLLRQRDLRLISVWHPSFLTLLLEALPVFWDKLLAQIRRENDRRAGELKHSDPWQPESLWPRLQAVSCWGDSHARPALADLRRRFPHVLVQAKGLLATEAFVTIPFGHCHPVAVRSHFFEFIDEQGRVRQLHELRVQETYEVVVTTAGGLWRYRMHDLVQVDGFLSHTPSLRFLGRSGRVSDRFGEKLSEAFAAGVVQEILAACGATPRFVLLAPDEDAAGWCYTLYFEGTPPNGLAGALDRSLRQNPNYDHCRNLGQLQPARVFAMVSNGYQKYTTRLVSEGQRLGDIKPVLLSSTAGWSKIFADT